MIRKTTAGVLALWLITTDAAAARTAGDLYYERTVMLAANARCRLFTPEIGSALAASALQARGAALRQGADAAQLAAAAERARAAAYRVACTSPDLATAAARVREAFSGYARTTWMNFPGEMAVWRAERRPTAPVVDHRPVDGPLWRLSERGRWLAGTGPAPVLGLADDLSRPLVLAPTAAAAAASTAFLIVRDTAKVHEPYLPPSRDLAVRVPPRPLTRAFVLQSKAAAPASLLDHGRGPGTLFGFPPDAAVALESLDPREVVAIEITFPGRTPPLRAVFEAGDFAAARAFLLAR